MYDKEEEKRRKEKEGGTSSRDYSPGYIQQAWRADLDLSPATCISHPMFSVCRAGAEWQVASLCAWTNDCGGSRSV